MTEFLTAAQAAQRLGVKPATLYAYVSRGVLRRDRAADGRGSLFDSDEVERLARRGRPRRPAGVADITVESAITEITGDRLRYRGLDVIGWPPAVPSRTSPNCFGPASSQRPSPAAAPGSPKRPGRRRGGRRPPRWPWGGERRPRYPPGRCRSSGSR